MGHIRENGLHLGKMGHTCKEWVKLGKWVKVKQMGHSWNNGPSLAKMDYI